MRLYDAAEKSEIKSISRKAAKGSKAAKFFLLNNGLTVQVRLFFSFC